MNRHIRRDFESFYDFSLKREGRSLCGKRTTEPFLGIPSVTEESQWCIPCCREAMRRVKAFEDTDYQFIPDAVKMQWVKFGSVVGKTLYRLP